MASCAASAGIESRGSSSSLLKTAQPRLSVFSPLQLKANVNLNLPPPNWLRASSPATAFSRVHSTPHPVTDSEPSSTVLASYYPHAVGEVDVVSDSQNIKKLLKLPYCGSPVSMAIHRVGKTLLIDEFSAPMAQVSASLDKLFEENMPQLWFTARKKHPALTRHRNLYSKLLYYSLVDRALPPPVSGADSVKSLAPHTSVSSLDITSTLSVVDDVTTSTSSTNECSINQTGLQTSLTAQPGDSTVPMSRQDESTVCDIHEERGMSSDVTPPPISTVEPLDSPPSVTDERGCTTSDEFIDSSYGNEKPAIHIPSSEIMQVGRRKEGKLEGEEGREDREESDEGIFSEREVGRKDGEGEEIGVVGEGRMVGSESEPCSDKNRGRCTGDKDDPFPYSPPLPTPQPFHHDVQWNIADIRMLLGSDLPIFGRDTLPAISLRLRDMKKPITVLTGLDYWLDNLMCNVPELAMCFHLDGIVQRYETVKTEDIPNLENSEFSPQEVLEVAQNILAFLKANCTREGHTYWLFRRRGDEVVKLYDITSLMEINSSIDDEEGEKSQNPFARSVAVLFYRVAKNMLNTPGGSPPSTSEELNMAKLLLENCISLLRDSKHIDNVNVSSSACYLLADLYLHRSCHSNSPYTVSPDHRPDIKGRSHDMRDDVIHTRSCDRKLSINSEEDIEDEEEEEGEGMSTACLSSLDSKSLSVGTLRQGPQTFSDDDPTHPLPPLQLGCSRDRARLALQSIAKGISILGESLYGTSPTSPDVPLTRTCGGHLLQKAGSAYLTLTISCTNTNKYGRALRYARCALLCFRSSNCCVGVNSTGQEPLDHLVAWQQCGDLHCLLSKQSCSSDYEDFQLENPEDTPIIAAATRLHPPDDKVEACLTVHSNRETSLWRSIDCYEMAQQLSTSLDMVTSDVIRTLKTHFGSAWNELGTYYMVMSSTLDYAQEKSKVEKLWRCSHSCLNRGLELFDSTDSSTDINRAITHANLGCLARACASIHTHLANTEGSEFTSDEKTYYEKSIQYYSTAQQLLKRQSVEPAFWTSLMCDLGTIHNTLAKQLLVRPPLSKLSPSEIERKIMESLMKSLHCIEPLLSVVDKNTPRFQVLHKLAGESHYQLGCLYKKSAFSHSSSTQKLKHSRSQSEKHYNKAYQYYLQEYHAKDILTVLLDKASLFELQAQGQGARLQLKLLENALLSLLQCESILHYYSLQSETAKSCEDHSTQPNTERPGNDSTRSTCTSEGCSDDDDRSAVGGGSQDDASLREEESDAIVSLLLQRLLNVLKQLVAIAMKKSEFSKPLASYKAMYAVALRGSQYGSSTRSEQIEQARQCLRTVASVK